MGSWEFLGILWNLLLSLLSRILAFLKPAGCEKVFDPESTDTDSLMSSSGANWKEYYLFGQVTDDNQEWYKGSFDVNPLDPGTLASDENDQIHSPEPIRFAYEIKRIGPQKSIGVVADLKFLARILWYQSSRKIMENVIHGDVDLPADQQGAYLQAFSIKHLLSAVFTKIRAEYEWTHPLINVWMPNPESMNTESGQTAAIWAFTHGLMKETLAKATGSGWQQPDDWTRNVLVFDTKQAEKLWKELRDNPPRKLGWRSPEPHTDYATMETTDNFYEEFAEEFRDLDSESLMDMLQMFSEAAARYDEERKRLHQKGTLSVHGIKAIMSLYQCLDKYGRKVPYTWTDETEEDIRGFFMSKLFAKMNLGSFWVGVRDENMAWGLMTDYNVLCPKPLDMEPVELDGETFPEYATIREKGGFAGNAGNAFYATTFPKDLTKYAKFTHGQPIPLHVAMERGMGEQQPGDEQVQRMGKWLIRNGDAIALQEIHRLGPMFGSLDVEKEIADCRADPRLKGVESTAKIDWSFGKVHGFRGTLGEYEERLRGLNTHGHQLPGLPHDQAFPTAIHFEDDVNAFWATNTESVKVFTIRQDDRLTRVDPMVRVLRIKPKTKDGGKVPYGVFLKMETEGSFCSNALVRPTPACYRTEQEAWKPYIVLGRPFQTDYEQKLPKPVERNRNVDVMFPKAPEKAGHVNHPIGLFLPPMRKDSNGKSVPIPPTNKTGNFSLDFRYFGEFLRNNEPDYWDVMGRDGFGLDGTKPEPTCGTRAIREARVRQLKEEFVHLMPFPHWNTDLQTKERLPEIWNSEYKENFETLQMDLEAFNMVILADIADVPGIIRYVLQTFGQIYDVAGSWKRRSAIYSQHTGFSSAKPADAETRGLDARDCVIFINADMPIRDLGKVDRLGEDWCVSPHVYKQLGTRTVSQYLTEMEGKDRQRFVAMYPTRIRDQERIYERRPDQHSLDEGQAKLVTRRGTDRVQLRQMDKTLEAVNHIELLDICWCMAPSTRGMDKHRDVPTGRGMQSGVFRMESIQVAFLLDLKDLRLLMGAATSTRNGIPGNSRFNAGPHLQRWPLALYAYPLFSYDENTGSHLVVDDRKELRTPMWDEAPKPTDFPPAGEGYPSKVHGMFVGDSFGIFTFDRATPRMPIDQPKREGPLTRTPYKPETVCFSHTEFISKHSAGLLRCLSPKIPEGTKAEGGPETPRTGDSAGEQSGQRPPEPEEPPIALQERIPAGYFSNFLPEDRVSDSVPWDYQKTIVLDLGLKPPEFSYADLKKDREKKNPLRQNPSAYRNHLFHAFTSGDIRKMALTVEQGLEDGTRWHKKVAPFVLAGPIAAIGTMQTLQRVFSVSNGYGNASMKEGPMRNTKHGFNFHTRSVHAHLLQNQCTRCWTLGSAWVSECVICHDRGAKWQREWTSPGHEDKMKVFKDQWRVLEAMARQIKDFMANRERLGFVYKDDWRSKFPDIEGYDKDRYADGQVMDISDLFFVYGGDERIYRLDLAQPYTRQAQLLVEMRIQGMKLGQHELHEYQRKTRNWDGDVNEARWGKYDVYTDGIAEMLGFEPGHKFEEWRPYSQVLVVLNAEIEQKEVYKRPDGTDEDPDRLHVNSYKNWDLEPYFLGKRWKPVRPELRDKDLYTELGLWKTRMPGSGSKAPMPPPAPPVSVTPPSSGPPSEVVVDNLSSKVDTEWKFANRDKDVAAWKYGSTTAQQAQAAEERAAAAAKDAKGGKDSAGKGKSKGGGKEGKGGKAPEQKPPEPKRERRPLGGYVNERLAREEYDAQQAGKDHAATDRMLSYADNPKRVQAEDDGSATAEQRGFGPPKKQSRTSDGSAAEPPAPAAPPTRTIEEPAAQAAVGPAPAEAPAATPATPEIEEDLIQFLAEGVYDNTVTAVMIKAQTGLTFSEFRKHPVFIREANRRRERHSDNMMGQQEPDPDLPRQRPAGSRESSRADDRWDEELRRPTRNRDTRDEDYRDSRRGYGGRDYPPDDRYMSRHEDRGYDLRDNPPAGYMRIDRSSHYPAHHRLVPTYYGGPSYYDDLMEPPPRGYVHPSDLNYPPRGPRIDDRRVRRNDGGMPEDDEDYDVDRRRDGRSSGACFMLSGPPPPVVSEENTDSMNDVAVEFSDMKKIMKLDYAHKSVGEAALTLTEDMRCEVPVVPAALLNAMLDQHAIWDPGATSDMGSLASALALDRSLVKESGGKLRGKWFKPNKDSARSFKVANGGSALAKHEVVWEIPVVDKTGKTRTVLQFQAACIDPGLKVENQVPYLFSNWSGKVLGARSCSRSGLLWSIDQHLRGFKAQMRASPSGHWMFPLVRIFLMFAGLLPWDADKHRMNQGGAFALSVPARITPSPGPTDSPDEDLEDSASPGEGSNSLGFADAVLTRKTPKNIPKENRGTASEPFPKRCWKQLPGFPRDIITVIWDEHGIRESRTFRKSKVFRPTWKGSPSTWRRRITLDETSGEILENVENPKYAVMKPERIKHRYVFVSPGDGTILGLRSSLTGWLVLPGGPVGNASTVGDFVRLIEYQTGLTLSWDGFVSCRVLGDAEYMIYTSPSAIVKRDFDHRTPDQKSKFPKFEIISARHPKPNAFLNPDLHRFLDCYGELVVDSLPKQVGNFAESRLCQCGMVSCLSTPVVCLPANHGEFEDPYVLKEDSELLKESWEQPAFYGTENSDPRTIWYHTGWYFEDQGGRERPNANTLFGQFMSDEDLKEKLESKAGIAKLHKQFWHLNADALFKRIQPLVSAGRMAEVKRLCEEVVKECAICRAHARPGARPKVGGLWAREPNHIVACDTFYLTVNKDGKVVPAGGRSKDSKTYAILHFVDLFSGFSVVQVCEHAWPLASDVIAGLSKWAELFGKFPIIFFTDQGGEFTDHSLVSFFHEQETEHLFAAPQAPYSNGVNERHNGILKVWLGKLLAQHGRLQDFTYVLREAVRVKNLTTRRHGWSARYLAFGYPVEDDLITRVGNLTAPETQLSADMLKRIAIRQAAQKLLYDVKIRQDLADALTRGLQATDKSRLTAGTLVDFWVIPNKGSGKKPYWEPNCRVIAMGSDKNNRTVIIRRATYSQYQEVERIRVRPQHVPNLLPIQALDPGKMPSSVKRILADGEPVAPPGLDREEEIAGVCGDLLLASFVRNNRHDRQSARDLLREKQHFKEQVEQFRRNLRKRKKKIEESDEERSSRDSSPARETRAPNRQKTRLDTESEYKHTCADCGSDFPSRNKLFKHLDEKDHQVSKEKREKKDKSDSEKSPPPRARSASPKRKPVTPAAKPPRTPQTERKWEKEFVRPAEDLYKPRYPRNANPSDKEDRAARRAKREEQRNRPMEDLPKLTSRGKVADQWTSKHGSADVPEGTHRGRGSMPKETKRPTFRNLDLEGEGRHESPTRMRGRSLDPEPWNRAAQLKRLEEEDDEDEQDPDTNAEHHAIGGDSGDEQENDENQPDWFDDKDEANQAEEEAEIPSDAETESRPLEDVLPKNFWVNFDSSSDPVLTLWNEDPSMDQVLLGSDAVDLWAKEYPTIYSLLANGGLRSNNDKNPARAKIKMKVGKGEVPRTVATSDPLFWRAMEKEIDQLKENGARFMKPPEQVNGKDIWIYSSRWVFTYKDDGTRKARIVVRGFEEAWDPNAEDCATDSPTLHKDSLRLLAFTAASRKWKLASCDIRTAFLQANTSDDPDQNVQEQDGLWIKVPKWFPSKYDKEREPGFLLKLATNKTLYGMASAPRRFFFTLRKVMLETGFVPSAADDCLFFLRDSENNLIGAAGWHVDDGLLTGTKEFWDAIDKVGKRLQFGSQKSGEFRFCGVNIRQTEDFSVYMDQSHAAKELEIISGLKGRPDDDPATPQEVTALRGRIGSLLYMTGLTRPFESYAVSHYAGYVTEATVKVLKQVNTVVEFVKANPGLGLHYPGGVRCDFMYTFHDSNFKQERDSGSQMGILSFVGQEVRNDKVHGACLLRWASKRARRVCHSTLAAETLAATGALDSQAGLRFRLNELDFYPRSVMLTDCRSLFDHVYSMTGSTAEMLLPDVHELREAVMPWRSALSEDYEDEFVELWWCDTCLQLADNLTKIATPSTKEFYNVIDTRIINLVGSPTANGKRVGFERPRPTQRAHSFWQDLLGFLQSWDLEEREDEATEFEAAKIAALG